MDRLPRGRSSSADALSLELRPATPSSTSQDPCPGACLERLYAKSTASVLLSRHGDKGSSHRRRGWERARKRKVTGRGMARMSVPRFNAEPLLQGRFAHRVSIRFPLRRHGSSEAGREGEKLGNGKVF